MFFLICCHYLVPKFKHRVAKAEVYILGETILEIKGYLYGKYF